MGKSSECIKSTKTGTRYFNAPERRKPGYNGYAADIFSLGVILFQLVTKSHPFREASF